MAPPFLTDLSTDGNRNVRGGGAVRILFCAGGEKWGWEVRGGGGLMNHHPVEPTETFVNSSAEDRDKEVPSKLFSDQISFISQWRNRV